MNWYHEIEDRILPRLFEGIARQAREVRHVELDFMNGHVQLTVPGGINHKRKQEIYEIVERAGKEIAPDVTDWSSFIPHSPVMTYTSHLEPGPRSYQPFQRPENVVVFDLPLDQALSMQLAEDVIADVAKSYNYIVAFALGGISILSRLSGAEWESVMPENPLEVPAAAKRFSDRFHLFPGLLWTDSEKESELFTRWLAELPAKSRIMLFDTGSSGNGPRRIANVVRKAIAAGCTVQAEEIRILAIVDRRDDDQKSEDVALETHRHERVRLIVDYHYVDRMFTEDCQQLLGYDSARGQGYIKPLRDNVVIRIVNSDGRPLRVIATTNVAGAYAKLLSEAAAGPPPNERPPLTETGERRIATLILQDAFQHERNQLHCAWAMGFINDDRYKGEFIGLKRRYEKAIGSYPGRRWDFAKKKIVRV